LEGRIGTNQAISPSQWRFITSTRYRFSGLVILGIRPHTNPDILSKCDLRTPDVLINLDKDIIARTDIGHSDGDLKRNMVNKVMCKANLLK
jgi:hypothetical protein